MFSSNNIIDGVLLLFLVVFASAVAFFENLLVNTVTMCAFSITIATLYLVMSAPDVAITEAAVGAGFSTVLMLLVLSYLGNWDTAKVRNVWHTCERVKLLVAGALSMMMFAALGYAVLDLPKFGDATSPANSVSSLSLADVYADTDIPNLVSAILASLRGYDTMCETLVVFTGAMCVSLLVGKGGHRRV
ncbi:DUF4040 domain-containing protein [Anaplasma phagocytophilum]|uniref:MrpA C-terminal/MbhD domain-containing protein n=2 Tax=Anaplasma phagocytophilum TaxID=948 RepID=A0A0F3NJ85_ANAPH|nr:hypothetical protein APHMUC_1632 [Anaplasma phagocytophilum str. ApMUC09]KJV67782.1 hypothetical protein APHNP_1486 [Anaplasma phagocytophilum str. ApNP]SCV62122.1 putative monovalent cation/H+ antiporter subunit B [Anaplasma phagocytophilum]